MQTRWVVVAVLLICANAAAVDVPLRDGTVIAAASHRVTGSYVMIELADGSRVAYDIADVDLEALRAAERAAGVEGGRTVSLPESSRETISGGRSLDGAGPAAGGEGDRLMISDLDVKHVRGSGVRGHEELQELDVAGDDGKPDGYQEGGRVLLNSVRVSPMGGGQWQIEGEVVNRNPETVVDVSVRLEMAAVGGGEPWSEMVAVTPYLGRDDTAPFSHSFAAEVPEGKPEPSVRAKVVWRKEEMQRTPDGSGADGGPRPGAVPYQFGGASTVPTPVG